MAIPQIIDMHSSCVGISTDLKMQGMPYEAGPPPSLNGMTVGMTEMAISPPHNGERHTDGDELLIVVTGSILIFPNSNPEEGFEVRAGQACIIPQNLWHVVKPNEPSHLIFITPGPNNEHR